MTGNLGKKSIYPSSDTQMNTKDLTAWSGGFRKTIKALTALAAFIFSMISGFLVPLGFASDERKAIVRFAPFILAILIGCAFVMRRKWAITDPQKWVLITVILLAGTILSWLLYWYYLSEFTCIVDTQRVIIGTEYTDQAAAYIRSNADMPCETLIRNYAGKIEMIWTRETVNKVRLYFQVIYLSCTILTTLCLLSLAQSMEDSDSGQKRSRKPGKNLSK